jgi:ABC-type uncharacterized transport system ATPase subunit
MNIEVSGLTKSYGDVLAVDHVSFSVAQGEILGYLGPNGAGKSTTVKMLTGILAPTRGLILADGREVQEDALAMKQRIGYVPESGGLSRENDLLLFACPGRGGAPVQAGYYPVCCQLAPGRLERPFVRKTPMDG